MVNTSGFPSCVLEIMTLRCLICSVAAVAACNLTSPRLLVGLVADAGSADAGVIVYIRCREPRRDGEKGPNTNITHKF